MKILALEQDLAGVSAESFQSQLKAEARRVWELQQDGIIREVYFRQEQENAVLVLECQNGAEALQVLNSLPLVQAGLISFEIIPLKAYPGFARLFEE